MADGIAYWRHRIADTIGVRRLQMGEQMGNQYIDLPHAQPRGDAALDGGCAGGVPGPPLLVRPPWLLVPRVQDV
eukprot:4622952-Heterocapsa_arctica.AAC.1